MTLNNHLTLLAYRHGQSVTNSGLTWPDAASIPLTELGHQQSKKLAASWTKDNEPDLIITSNMLRTQQTATPTCERFAHIETEIWPVHEFCYLSPTRCANTTWQQRQPWVNSYWAKADPRYKDDDGAESFEELINRIQDTLFLINERQKKDYQKIALFSHGQFLSVLHECLRLAEIKASSGRMQQFRERELNQPIKNAEGFIACRNTLVSHNNLALGWQISLK